MITDKILKRIKAKKRGWVFCAKDFCDLGSRNAIDKALSRMADDNLTDDNNKIARVIRGIYYYPIIQDNIGVIPPNLDDVANAIARNAGVAIYPSGAAAANMLGLSNQAPSKNIYWTHGKSMTRQVGKNIIQFKHIRTNPLHNTPAIVMMVLNAISYLGSNKIDNSVIKKCSEILSDSDKKHLQKMLPRVSDWVTYIIPKIIAAENMLLDKPLRIFIKKQGIYYPVFAVELSKKGDLYYWDYLSKKEGLSKNISHKTGKIILKQNEISDKPILHRKISMHASGQYHEQVIYPENRLRNEKTYIKILPSLNGQIHIASAISCELRYLKKRKIEHPSLVFENLTEFYDYRMWYEIIFSSNDKISKKIVLPPPKENIKIETRSIKFNNHYVFIRIGFFKSSETEFKSFPSDQSLGLISGFVLGD